MYWGSEITDFIEILFFTYCSLYVEFFWAPLGSLKVAFESYKLTEGALEERKSDFWNSTKELFD